MINTSLTTIPNNITDSTTYFCKSIWYIDVPAIHLIIYAFLHGISMPFTIAVNSILIYCLHKTGQLNSISNKFILAMSISDICSGMFAQPMIILKVSLRQKIQSCTLENCTLYIVFLLAFFSWFMLPLITIDRYLQITKLNRYREYMNLHRMRIAIFACFIMGNGVALRITLLKPFFIEQVIFNTFNFLIIVFLAILNARILKRLKAHVKTQNPVLRADVVANSSQEDSEKNTSSVSFEKNENIVRVQAEFGQQSNKKNTKDPRRHLTALKTIRRLIIAILLLYGPYQLAMICWTYFKFGKGENPTLGWNLFLYWANFTVMTNPTINAIIIINGNSKVRRMVLSKLRHFRRK